MEVSVILLRATCFSGITVAMHLNQRFKYREGRRV